MQATSELWKQLWQSETAVLESKAIINGVEYTEISPPMITRALTQANLSIGNVVSAVCFFSMDTSVVVPKSAEVQIKMRLTNGDDENPVTSEWLPVGTFYISKRTKDAITDVKVFECYDALLKTNAEWVTAFTTWPQPMADVLDEIATIIDVEIDERTVINTDAGYVINEPVAGTIMRDVLGVIGAYNGGNWIVTPDNKLRLVPINSADDAEEAVSDVVDIEITTDGVTADSTQEITGIRCVNTDNTSYLVGDETGIVISTTIPTVIALELSETLLGKKYQAFTLNGCHYDPAVELGDYVRYYDVVSGVIYSENITLGIDANGMLMAPDAEEITDEYPYVGAKDKTLTAAKAYVNEAINNYDDSLTQLEVFNRLTGNGTAQGLVLVNGQLYVNASYIHSGTLVLGGLNNQSGILRLLDATGSEAGRMDNSGIEVTNGVVASYAADQQSRVMLYDGSFGYQEWDTGPDGLEGWQDRLVLHGDNSIPTVSGYTGLLISSKEGDITLRNKYAPYLTGGIIEMEQATGKIFMRAASDTMMDATMTLYDGEVVIGDSTYAPECDLKVIGDAYANNFRGALIGNVTGHASSDLALSGGTMTGKITFNKVNNAIAYTGTKASYDMIKFIDNTGDEYGNGISIGGGGAVVIGGGESANTAAAQVSGGGNEILYLCNDNDVTIFSNMQSGWDSRKTFTFGANGTLTAPAFSGPLTGNVTGNCSGSSGSCTGNAATATRANSAGGLWVRTSLTKGTNPSSTQWTGPTIFTYQTGTGTAHTDRIAGCVESYIDANGLSALCLRAYRFASGQTSTNSLEIRCAKDGTASYTVTNQGAFRNAIGFAVKKVSGTTNSYGNISLSLDATRYAIIYCRSSGGYMAEGFASSDGTLWAHVANYSTYQANKSVTIWALYIDMGTNGMNT